MMIKTIAIGLKKALCLHKFSFEKTDVIGCKRVSIHICMHCGKRKYIAFENGLESLERYYNVSFD